ncbi:MAG: metal ABC transporter substrate-binding protein, partial [Candidatus Sumerlaeaceae bacterium]
MISRFLRKLSVLRSGLSLSSTKLCAEHVRLAVALGASVALLLAGCAQKLPEKKRDGRLRVVATTSIVADMVHQIAGDRIELHALMGAGVDPHLYKASEGDVLRIAQADVVFYNGLHLEAKMADVLEKISKRVRTVAVTARIPRERLLRTEANHETPDPHVWFDVGLWRLTVPEIRDALSELDPA